MTSPLQKITVSSISHDIVKSGSTKKVDGLPWKELFFDRIHIDSMYRAVLDSVHENGRQPDSVVELINVIREKYVVSTTDMVWLLIRSMPDHCLVVVPEMAQRTCAGTTGFAKNSS